MKSTDTATAPVPYDCPELRELAKAVKAADALKTSAESWITQLDEARAAHAENEARFVANPTAALFREHTRTAATVRDLAGAVGSLVAAGTPDRLRRDALATPEVFDLFAAGFARRLGELEGLKKAAFAILAARRSGVTLSGAVSNPLLVDHDPSVREALAVVVATSNAVQSATELCNYAVNRGNGPVAHSFDAMISLLSAPLPALPVESTPAAR